MPGTRNKVCTPSEEARLAKRRAYDKTKRNRDPNWRGEHSLAVQRKRKQEDRMIAWLTSLPPTSAAAPKPLWKLCRPRI